MHVFSLFLISLPSLENNIFVEDLLSVFPQTTYIIISIYFHWAKPQNYNLDRIQERCREEIIFDAFARQRSGGQSKSSISLLSVSTLAILICQTNNLHSPLAIPVHPCCLIKQEFDYEQGSLNILLCDIPTCKSSILCSCTD